MLRTGVVPALMVGLVVQFAITPALSQGPQTASPTKGPQTAQSPAKPTAPAKPNPPKIKKSPQQIEQETYFQQYFKKPMPLPDIPELGGTKFRFGLERQDPKGSGGTLIGQKYGTSMNPKDVLDFYKNSLVHSQWKLTASSEKTVQATKADRKVVINIMPKASMDVKTDFMINYSYR